MNATLENALIEGIWAAYRACYEANAVWDTSPGAHRRYDEASARKARLIEALCDGDDELQAWLSEHIFDLIDEGPKWLGDMFREHRSWLAADRVEMAMCVLADVRQAAGAR